MSSPPPTALNSYPSPRTVRISFCWSPSSISRRRYLFTTGNARWSAGIFCCDLQPTALRENGFEIISAATPLQARFEIEMGRCGIFLTSRGPGLWSGQSGKELVLAEPFLHPETERQATEVGRYGSGVWLEHRSLAWSQVPCAEQWLTVG